MQELVTGCWNAVAGVDGILPVEIGKGARRFPGAGLSVADLLPEEELEWTRRLMLLVLLKGLLQPQTDSKRSRKEARTCGRDMVEGKESGRVSMQCTFITELLSDDRTESPDGALVSASTHALLDPVALSAAEGSVCGVRRAHVPSPGRRWAGNGARKRRK